MWWCSRKGGRRCSGGKQICNGAIANIPILVGDDELLEAIDACPKIFSGGGESHCEVARQFHGWFSGGKVFSRQ